MLVATAFVATMISCSQNTPNNPSNDEIKGCTCEYYDPDTHESWTEYFSLSEMKSQFGVSNCGALSSAVKADSYGGDFSVRCHE